MELEKLSSKFIDTKSLEDGLNLLRFCRTSNDFNLGELIGRELIKIFPFSFDLKDEYGMCCYYAGQYYKSFEVYQNILSHRTLDEFNSKKYRLNAHFSANHIKDSYIFYNENKIWDITKKSKNIFPLITFTITTCKRFDLFSQTMNSFINCCLDVELIDEWVCIDDNSSEEDREKMTRLYPFFKYIFKNMENKGHAKSMNMLREYVKTPYVFHMEDDWKFFTKRNYMSDCFEILNSNSKFGQCLINKNYGELIKDRDFIGGEFDQTSSGLRYYIHEHCSNQVEFQSFYSKRGSDINCAYWPHFSLRPSLLKKKIWDTVGKFKPEAPHFEMDYSYRYFDLGYRSVFLEDIYCIHIGKLTTEIGENAYSLNEESQFKKEPEKEIGKTEDDQNDYSHNYRYDRYDDWKNICSKRKMNTIIINLDRRPDRMEKMNVEAERERILFNIYSAVDGKNIKSNFQLRRLFDPNDYNWRRGMIGCALSHISLWIELLYSEEYEEYLILEDDAKLFPEFLTRFEVLLKTLPENYDFLYLGHHIYEKYVTDKTFSKDIEPVCEKWSTGMSLKFSRGGTIGYLINKKGAEKLLEFINDRGMTNGIDTMQQKAADIANVYYSMPHLICSDCYTGSENTDTDIQKDYNSLRMDINERLLIEFDLFITLKLKVKKIDDIDTQIDFFKDDIDTQIDFFKDTVIYIDLMANNYLLDYLYERFEKMVEIHFYTLGEDNEYFFITNLNNIEDKEKREKLLDMRPQERLKRKREGEYFLEIRY